MPIDSAPLMPLSSKQSKLLGVMGPDMNGNGNGVESRGQSANRGGASTPNPALRGTKSSSVLRPNGGSGGPGSINDGASVKEKKRGMFSKLLRKSSSRVDLHEEVPEPSSYGEFTGGNLSILDGPLPQKLVARGDAEAFHHPSHASTSAYGSKNGKTSKSSKARKPSTPTRAPPNRQMSLFPGSDSTGITLDTNLADMDDIIDKSKAPNGAVGGLEDFDERNSSFSGSALGSGTRPSVADSLSYGTGSTADSSSAGGYRNNRADSSISQISGGFWNAPHHLNPAAEPISPTSAVPPMSMTNGFGTMRPGLGRYQSSSSMRNGIPEEARRGSTGGGVGAVAGAPAPQMAGAWTAPDSWAVKGDTLDIAHDSSDSESDGDGDGGGDGDGDEDGSENGLSPVPTSASVFEKFGVGPPDDLLGVARPGTSNGRPGTRSGRPGTADGLGRNGERGQKSFMVRIFRHDATFSTLPAPLTATAADLTSMLARRFQVNANSRYMLYVREKGIERRMGPNEKPILIQKRRLEQAGYTELDKLEDLGREDNSYLLKLIYKPAQSSRAINEEDFSESVEFIDLSGRNVETIPIPLYKQAHQIVSLNLSRNRPFELPTDFVQSCTTLRELVLSHMGIKRIPQAVRECHSLTRLDISNNHIVDFEHIALDELSELTSLKCHNNRLWTLPDYFAEFKMLKYLNLSNNRFEIFPPVVCEITSLVELDVSFNTISLVPSEIGQLVNLDRLLLLANTINSLPSTLHTLSHLKELDCRRNQISDLSAVVGIARLEVLRVEYNQASLLDASWAHMRILNASNNSITRFALSGTSNTLTSLNLSNAKLSSLPNDMFDHLGAVEHLVFDSNQLRVLPEGVGSLTNLVTLSIKNNLLDNIPSTIGKLQRLQSLTISGNNLSTLPAQIWLCSSLNVLNASSNLLNDFPDPPLASAPAEPNLEELDSRKLSTISKAPSTSSGRITLALALSLQKLYLGDNVLGDDIFVPISLLTELRVLNLSFNDIYDIPSGSLFKFQQMEELYLSGNKIGSLPPQDLERLVSLKLLYLNGNKLQTLPAELHKITKLAALDVGSNTLKYNIANWPYDWNWNWNLELRYLNLSGNKRLEIKPGAHPLAQGLPGDRRPKNLADFSALSRLRVLGLMDVTLMIPSLPDESEDRRVRTSLSEINEMAYGVADTLGNRQDVLSLVDIVLPRFRTKDDEAIFGLFDAVSKGPNTGAKLVKWLQDNFAASFTLELSRLKNVEVMGDALRRTFLAINRDYGNLVLPPVDPRRKNSEVSLAERAGSPARTGAAGIIVYIRKKRMWVANAGNSLAVISGRGGAARLIAKKHEPFDAAEIARIRMAEGWISARGAVNDEVDISRSFGFYNVFPAINASPNVEEVELVDSDEFVIVANRGLWDYVSYQGAVDIARKERADPMTAAAKLRDLAMAYGSSGNIMVMVVAVSDLFKVKKDYRSHRSHGQEDLDGGFYGTNRALMRRGARGDDTADRTLQSLPREVEPPTGSLALVFTDIRNSTALWESNGGMQAAIRIHNDLLRRQLRAIGGYEVKTEGDAFIVSFPTVTSALLWCLTVQLELLRIDWPQEILDSNEGKEIMSDKGELIYRGLSVRMGIHWGSPVCEADPITRRMDYFGPMVNRSARISAVAEGGQISCSQDVVDIIHEVVMERKPAPSSLDSDSGSDAEEEEEWLDPREKQDVIAIRRLGFGITPIGERRLKGLETAESISLVWPTALRARIENKVNAAGAAPTELVHDPSTQLLDATMVREIGRVCQRLEAAAGLIAHPEHFSDSPEESTPEGRLAIIKKRMTIPHALSFSGISPTATDEELAAILEHLIVRVEHCLSTLVLHQLGPFTEVLSALGGAIGTDPRYITNALGRFAALMGSP
ncbi:adenylate cyclase [Pseudohyphozyma bogoriensis]|nr:adenylate cyclase [Pseudohyphozyma bogoriensis]